MDQYAAPIDDIVAAMRTAGLAEVLGLAVFDGIDEGAVRDVLAGFGDLAAGVIAPTDRIGDQQGARLDPATGAVSVPGELAHAFREYVQGGWQGIGAAAEHGGGGFPKVVQAAVHEMFGSANMSLSLNPLLTQSAIELLERWGDERQQRVVLRRLVGGEWTGTMNLTEPEAGSDLGAVRTMAEPTGDGRWAINGTKIFITWGEHSLADNIIHLVLARTPGAPAGIKGISLFLVPKVHFADDGTLGAANGVRCVGLEHKLGIHASPTCVLSFDDAVGELVGPLHGGMAAMFSMMNPARLGVGVQGVSIAERSRQQALAYAQERRQGSDPSLPDPQVPIVVHPDVRRALADIATTTDAIRLLTYATAIAADIADHHPDEGRRAAARRRVDLLTPLAKAFSTDQGVRVASTAVQVHGGMGFIEETGIAQRYRDARITPIYEGTNGIQSIDLMFRKVVRDEGLALGELLAEAQSAAADAAGTDELRGVAKELAAAVDDVRAVLAWVSANHATDRRSVLTGATPFLELVSLVATTELLVRHALATAGAVAAARVEWWAATQLRRRPALVDITLPSTLVDAALGV